MSIKSVSVAAAVAVIIAIAATAAADGVHNNYTSALTQLNSDSGPCKVREALPVMRGAASQVWHNPGHL